MPKTKKRPPLSVKGTKIQIRLRPAQKALLARAAALKGTNLSSFVLENACQAAEQVLADQVHFVLPEASWKAFCEALDRPARRVPALEKLFAAESVFDDERTAAAE